MTTQLPDARPCRVEDDEINLVDITLILWRRKTQIIVLTLLLTLAATGISFLMPKIYEVVTILEPGKRADGVLVKTPQTVRENILGGAYDQTVANTLNIPLADMPEFNVVIPRDTNLVKISVESSEPEQAVRILQELLIAVSSDIQEELNISIKKTKNEIAAAQMEDVFLADQIKLIKEQIAEFTVIINELRADRKKAMADSRGDSMALLLYSTEVQNKQIYLNNLQERLERISLEKKQVELKVNNIQLKLASFKGTNINKSPSSPEKPKKPKKAFIVALAFMLGLVGSIMLAFFAEFVTKVRQAGHS
ncbi:MAG: Wzz/FepE/Etk N-terminal domain-containing protein [Desulforhopalus sp.]